jgi:hypothetical protein
MSSWAHQILCGRVKLAVEDIEAEEAALLEDLYAADRKFSEYYNVGDCFITALNWELPLYRPFFISILIADSVL